jgi:chaperonin GroES
MADKLNIKPLGGRILVQPLEEEEVTESGLIIPDTADKEKPQQGVVVALGTGKVTEDGDEMDFRVEVGDKVLFKKYSPDEVEMGGEEYLVMDEDDVLAVIDD